MPIGFLRKLRAVRLRLQLIEVCRKTLIVTAWLGGALAATVLASRLFSFEAIFGATLDFKAALAWTGAAAALGLVAWIVVRRIRLFEAAARADETLGLKERLSSAYLIGSPKSDPENAVVEDATRWAESIRPSQAFRFRLDREMKMAAAPLFLLAVFSFLPHFNFFAGAEEDAATGIKGAVAIETKKDDAAEKLKKLAEELKKADAVERDTVAKELDREIQAIALQLREQEISIEKAIAGMSKMENKLAARRSEVEKQLERAEKIQEAGKEGLTSEAAKALKTGNFDKAAKAMEELKDKLQRGELSEGEKTDLQKSLESLAADLGEGDPLGESLKAAADKLGEGMQNAALAELDSAIGDMMDMSQMLQELAMLEALQQGMAGRKKAMSGQPGFCAECGAATGLGGECAACNGGGSGQGQGMGQGMGGRGQWRAGETNRIGSGMGGPGQGRGNVAQSNPHDVKFQMEKIQGQLEAGKIIGRMKVPGEQLPGEITVQFNDLHYAAEQRANDTIHNELLPLESRALIRKYFDAIRTGGPGGATHTPDDGHDRTTPPPPQR